MANAKLVIRSWYLARSLGVTKAPPLPGILYLEIAIDGGPALFWPIVENPKETTAQPPSKG
jgi:hypothetical protein